MGRKISWTLTAIRQRKEILDYWSKRNQSTRYSLKLRQLIRQKLLRIAEQPYIGNLTEEDGTHRTLAKDYIIFYSVTEKQIEVQSIWDTRRNPDDAPYSY